MMLVADASTTLEWFLPGPPSSAAATSLKVAPFALLVVPAIWAFETQNAVLKLMRRRKISAAEAGEIRTELALISRRVMDGPDPEAMERTWEIATHQMMTFYDALYVQLAWQLQLPLASSDNAMRAAAIKLGIKLV